MLQITKDHFFDAYLGKDLSETKGVLVFKGKTVKVLQKKEERQPGDRIIPLSCQLFCLLHQVKSEGDSHQLAKLKWVGTCISQSIKRRSLLERVFSALSNFFHGYGLQSDLAIWQKIERLTAGLSAPILDPKATPSQTPIVLDPEPPKVLVEPSLPISAPLKEREQWQANDFDAVSKEEALEIFDTYKKTVPTVLLQSFSLLGEVDDSPQSQKFKENFTYVIQFASLEDIASLVQSHAFALEIKSSPAKLSTIFHALSKEQLIALTHSYFSLGYLPEHFLFLNLVEGFHLIKETEVKEVLLSNLIEILYKKGLLTKYLNPTQLETSPEPLKENLANFLHYFVGRFLSSSDPHKDQMLALLAYQLLDSSSFDLVVKNLTADEKKQFIGWAEALALKIQSEDYLGQFARDFAKCLNVKCSLDIITSGLKEICQKLPEVLRE